MQEAATLELRARELLAVEYDRSGYPTYADLTRAAAHGEFTMCTIRAVVLALQIREARELQMRAALEQIASIENKEFGLDWEEIEEARNIALAALATEPKCGNQ